MNLHIGLDIGSTTVKMVLLNDDYEMLHGVYRRHFSDIGATLREVIDEAYPKFKNESVTVAVTGSGGLSVQRFLEVDFVQEVVAAVESVKHFIPETDVVVELGGEDSKITFLRGSMEQRMNSICAGGTGAFIDQMASLLETDASGLNELSKKAKKVYPIASRCGVFAKTDIQALMNQGIAKEDIALSVFQSVVNQTVSNLACGRTIQGHVAFLGGPLHYLDGLVERFKVSLELQPEEVIRPDHSQLYVAMGAAIASMEMKPMRFHELFHRAHREYVELGEESNQLDPLFRNSEEYEEFQHRHEYHVLKYGELEGYRGKAYLGIDAGSTTTKLIVLSEKEEILYQYYGNNFGKPLEVVTDQLLKIYASANPEMVIAGAGVTGYGEDFLKAALNLDVGEVETIAHFRAAEYYNEDVGFILDIGGQDMKAMTIRDGVIQSILLNEACSSGCGSFLETFAKSLNLTVSEFSKLATSSERPVDLGSRCTVFMNSKVKQAQKEGATVADIAAGLSYSVIRNALQKVIKLRNFDEMGDHIVVQGGTFLSDGILRAFEKLSGKTAIRPKIAGLMGAFGMALIAKEKSEVEEVRTGQPTVSTVKNAEELRTFSYTTSSTHCGGCANNCTLTINRFSDGRKYITGNRCERPLGKTEATELLPNLFTYKNKRAFDYVSLKPEEASRGTMGIPRVLNMYENYPFWHTLFTSLGYSVVLSTPSDRAKYEKGIASITSETLCYPAKLVHGHIEELIETGVDCIFYPSVFHEEKEFERADHSINCPVVTGYPDVVRNNTDNLKKKNVKYINPFVSFADRKAMMKKLPEALEKFGLVYSKKEIRSAMERAFEALDAYRSDIRREGTYALEYMKEHGKEGVVLAGRPYHVDPEINHGIPELLNTLGVVVLSEDSVAWNVDVTGRLRVLDQWSYHARLYRAAKFVGEHEHLNLIQLNSFGCGIDAVTVDQVHEILDSYGKIYTVLKIDEVNNLGAAKIRIRSLLQALENKKGQRPLSDTEEKGNFYPKVREFTAEDRKLHTILAPQMAPIHFAIIEPSMRAEGYQIEFLNEINKETINKGVQYVNNDACYPTMFVVGQFIQAMESGKYDPDHTSLIMSQTGGACRASNYVGFIRKALKDAGYPQVPVIALSAQGIESNSGFQLSLGIVRKFVFAILYGDLLMRLQNEVRPYENIEGSTDLLVERWIEKLREDIASGAFGNFKKNVDLILFDFNALERSREKKPKAGIVGEILVKFLPQANNFVQKIMEDEGMEVVVPDLMDFFLYCFRDVKNSYDFYGGKFGNVFKAELGVKYVEHYRDYIRQALKEYGFSAPLKIQELEKYAQEIVSLGHQYGEGWLLTAEMVELVKTGAPNIVCVQPFGCLPNHLTGKGAIKSIREKYPTANIVPIDYDPGASEVNQVNRIKLMLSQAKANFYGTDRKKTQNETKSHQMK